MNIRNKNQLGWAINYRDCHLHARRREGSPQVKHGTKAKSMLRLPVKTLHLCWVCTTSGFSLAIRLSGVRRLAAELVEASPHLEIAPPSVHVTWWVGFLILIDIEKLKNRIKITAVEQLKWSSLKVLKHEPSQGTFSQCSEFWQADCPSRRGAPPPC